MMGKQIVCSKHDGEAQRNIYFDLVLFNWIKLHFILGINLSPLCYFCNSIIGSPKLSMRIGFLCQLELGLVLVIYITTVLYSYGNKLQVDWLIKFLLDFQWFDSDSNQP